MRLWPRAALLSLLWAGCGRAPRVPAVTAVDQPDPAPDLGAVVARVGGVPIYAEELRAQCAHTGQPPRAALDELIRLELMAARAHERSISPGDSHNRRALLVQRMIERDFERHTNPQDIPDEALRALYDKLSTNYVRPRLVEVALLSVYTGVNMKPEPRARAKATADALTAYLASHPPRTADDLAAIAHDPTWSNRRVQYARFWQGQDARFGGFAPPVANILQKLHRSGEPSGRIDDESGYHFALYLGERAPVNVPFTDVREELRRQYYPHWRSERFVQMSGALLADHRVEVYVDRALSAPAAE